jgi:hypothetical protein
MADVLAPSLERTLPAPPTIHGQSSALGLTWGLRLVNAPTLGICEARLRVNLQVQGGGSDRGPRGCRDFGRHFPTLCAGGCSSLLLHKRALRGTIPGA